MAELSKTARASMKGDKKEHAAEEVTLEKALKTIRGGLEAKLFIPVHFWEVVLAAYDAEVAKSAKLDKDLAAAKTQIEDLKAASVATAEFSQEVADEAPVAE